MLPRHHNYYQDKPPSPTESPAPMKWKEENKQYAAIELQDLSRLGNICFLLESVKNDLSPCTVKQIYGFRKVWSYLRRDCYQSNKREYIVLANASLLICAEWASRVLVITSSGVTITRLISASSRLLISHLPLHIVNKV